MPEPKLLNSMPEIEAWRSKASNGKASSKVLLRKEFISDIEMTEDRSIRFTITTGEPDRERDVIDPAGWDLSAFLKNPVVLFAHDYDSLPVAKATTVEQQGDKLIATAEFAPADLNPMAEQVFQMLKAGFLKGASVGFRPLTFEYNETRGGIDFREQELLEFSIVPVPANAQALMAAGLDGVDVEVMRGWAEKTLDALNLASVSKGIAPTNVSTVTAPMDTPWRKPNLGDFVDESWEDLANRQKRKITGHYAWATGAVPDKFGDMKLPHHRAKDGYVVWRGVVAATARLDQTMFPREDMGAVKRHLARHYKEFDKTAPWERDASSWEAFCKARDRAQIKAEASLQDDLLARLLDDFGFEDDAITLVALHHEKAEAMDQTKQEPEYEAESMAQANELIDKLRKDLNAIQDVAKRCIVGIDEYQNSLRRDSQYEMEDDDEEKNDKQMETKGEIKEGFDSFDEDDTVIELALSEDTNLEDIDMDNLADEIKSALTQTIGESVRSEIRSSVNAMRGRVD
jgi:HK97 family phage prohead protease